MDHAEPQDLLLCLGSGKRLDDPDRRTLIEGNYSLRPQREVEELFSYVPESVEATQEIADKIDIEIPHGDFLLPHYSLIPEEREAYQRYIDYIQKDTSQLVNLDEEEWLLRYLCISGLNTRYDFDWDENTVFEYVKKVSYDP